MEKLAGRTAFVTGAASGIGLGIATVLARSGVKVMLCDIEEAALDEARAGLEREGADVTAVKADVSDKAQLERAADATLARYGKLHILVNNAGVGGAGSYGSWSEAGWNWMIDVNLMAVIWGVEIFGPLIERHGEGGHIVSTASMAGLVTIASSPYSVTKYGVVALSEGLRRELAPRGVGVSVLCPGVVRSRIADSDRNLPPRFQSAVARAPLPRPTARESDLIRKLIDRGIDAHYVGELVREGIEGDWPYIFTDLDFEPAIDDRFAAIKQGFDRIRERVPRR